MDDVRRLEDGIVRLADRLAALTKLVKRRAAGELVTDDEFDAVLGTD